MFYFHSCYTEFYTHPLLFYIVQIASLPICVSQFSTFQATRRKASISLIEYSVSLEIKSEDFISKKRKIWWQSCRLIKLLNCFFSLFNALLSFNSFTVNRCHFSHYWGLYLEFNIINFFLYTAHAAVFKKIILMPFFLFLLLMKNRKFGICLWYQWITYSLERKPSYKYMTNLYTWHTKCKYPNLYMNQVSHHVKNTTH